MVGLKGLEPSVDRYGFLVGLKPCTTLDFIVAARIPDHKDGRSKMIEFLQVLWVLIWIKRPDLSSVQLPHTIDVIKLVRMIDCTLTENSLSILDLWKPKTVE